MQHAAEPLVAQLEHGDGAMLVGDIGLIAVKAMLEHGVGYVVTGWTEAAHPIDAAIHSCRRSVFARRGILLRRLRNVDAVIATIQEPGSSAFGSDVPMRGVVVWNGRSGTRPALEQLLMTEVPGPVVVLCEDPDVLRIADAAVFDPAPTPQSFVGAIDAAVELSRVTGKPAGVLIRSRSLDMRGTHACRMNVSVSDAGRIDGSSEREVVSLPEAIDLIGANRVVRGAEQSAAVILAPAAVAQVVIAGIDLVVQSLVDAGCNAAAAVARDTSVVSQDVSSVITTAARNRIVAAESVLMLDAVRSPGSVEHQSVDGVEVVRRGIVCERLDVSAAAQLVVRQLSSTSFAERFPEAIEILVSPSRTAHPDHIVSRLPRRGAGMSGPVPDRVSAALVIAQADIGVPARMSDHHPSYLTVPGGAITVVSAQRLGAEGSACAAPQARNGTFVVYGAMTVEVQTACAVMGATIELVSDTQPRRVAAAISRSVTATALQPRVVFICGGASDPIDPSTLVGVDRDLIRVERLSSTTMPEHVLGHGEDHDDPLSSGVAVRVVDACAAQAGLGAAQELSSGWFALRRSSSRPLSKWSEMTWSLRRRLIRSIGGVEL